MTFILERVYSNSMYFSVFFTWCWSDISFPYKSFRNEFIPVFSQNKIVVLVGNFFLVRCKLKTNFVPIANRVVWRMRIRSLAKTALAPYHTSGQAVIMWMQHLLDSGTKLTYGMKVIPVSYKHPLTQAKLNPNYAPCALKSSFRLGYIREGGKRGL